MVATFQSADKDAGVRAADELRNRIARDVDARKLFVMSISMASSPKRPPV
jgi:hypothetical protein